MKFNEFRIEQTIIEAALQLGYEEATKVQEQVIPSGLAGNDLWVRSQTGSGKTAAFGTILCERVDWMKRYPQALVLVPTRELALQVSEELKNLGRLKRVHTLPLFGRVSIENQELALKQKTHIVVGTPGRVRDLIQRGSFHLEELRYVVIDEADEMFFIGLCQQVEDILKLLPGNRQTMLFSATLSEEIEQLTMKYMKQPKRIEIDSETKTAKEVMQFAIPVEEKEKLAQLVQLCINENPKSCIIFANTQVMADTMERQLKKHQFSCCKLHGGMDQKERMFTMRAFRHGDYRYLIATDVAARGIDIDAIDLVINFDFPRGTDNYIHRIGRSGRAGLPGKAYTFYTEQEASALQQIIAETNASIPTVLVSDFIVDDQKTTDFFKLQHTKPTIKQEKSHTLNQSITKLCIRAGKKDKIRTCEIVATICSIDGIQATDIGIIQIQPMMTTVEILNSKGNQVLAAIAGKTIKGKIRKVYKAK